MEPNNIILGDGTGVDLPKMQVEEETLVEEKKMAKYSKTAEFKKIKKHFEDRIAFYQKYMPDGRPVVSVSPKELEGQWVLANAVITEFEAVINMFEIATEAVEQAEKYER